MLEYAGALYVRGIVPLQGMDGFLKKRSVSGRSGPDTDEDAGEQKNADENARLTRPPLIITRQKSRQRGLRPSEKRQGEKPGTE